MGGAEHFSKVRLDAAFGLTAGDKGLEGFAAVRLQRRRRIMFESILEDAMGRIISGRRASLR